MKKLPLILGCLVIAVGVAHATPYVWTGGGGDSNWNNAANWSLSAVPDGSPAISTFGNFGPSPLNVILTGSSPRSYMNFGDLRVTSAANADLSLAAPIDSILNNVTLESGGTYQKVAINGSRVRLNVVSAAWEIAAGKELVFNASIVHGGGGVRSLSKTGAGLLDYRGASIGQAYGADDNRSVSFTVTEGLFALASGVGQTVNLVSSATSGRQPVFTVKSGATLQVDVGSSGDLLQNVRATGASTTEAFQSNWLKVESGAILDVNLLSGYQENVWYSIFRNVGAPDHAFTVQGLDEGLVASFRLFEYSAGLFDYQIMVAATSTIPEPGSYALIFGAVSVLALAGRKRRAR